MPDERPVGIDLGTTNSAMASLDEAGQSVMLPNAEGELITPSIVFFGESEVVVGRNARTAITAYPDMVAQWVKRDMGAPFYAHPIRGQRLPPEVIQACILRKLKNDVTRIVGPHPRTVITVPAYFDELRRKATADAGDMAGLRVLDIVNEPTAAALAFGEAIGFLSANGLPQDAMNVMVYDLGGGTFDATLLNMSPGTIKTLATDGDVQLGGHDWDQRIVDYVAESFRKANQADPRQDPTTLNRLYQDVAEAKHTLSARSRASIQVNHAGRSMEVQILREQFEEMTADLMERTAYTSRQLLNAAGLQWKDVQRILLVGGSTRMPMVSHMLKSLTGIEPDRTVNPDEAVARGAALYAGFLLAKQRGKQPSSFHVSNVNAHSLGIEGIDTDTLRRKNVVLIPRNTRLPAKHTERFATKSDGQKSIVIKVLEGESAQPAECIPIGRTVVRDLPAGLPKGWPIEITFEYGTNSRLTVHATVPGTQHRARLDLERDVGLSGEGLARWKSLVNAGAGFQTFQAAAAAGVGQIAPAPAEMAATAGRPSGPPTGANTESFEAQALGWVGGEDETSAPNRQSLPPVKLMGSPAPAAPYTPAMPAPYAPAPQPSPFAPAPQQAPFTPGRATGALWHESDGSKPGGSDGQHARGTGDVRQLTDASRPGGGLGFGPGAHGRQLAVWQQPGLGACPSDGNRRNGESLSD